MESSARQFDVRLREYRSRKDLLHPFHAPTHPKFVGTTTDTKFSNRVYVERELVAETYRIPLALPLRWIHSEERLCRCICRDFP